MKFTCCLILASAKFLVNQNKKNSYIITRENVFINLIIESIYSDYFLLEIWQC